MIKFQISVFDSSYKLLGVVLAHHCDITSYQSIFYIDNFQYRDSPESEILRITSNIKGIQIRDGKIFLLYAVGYAEIIKVYK